MHAHLSLWAGICSTVLFAASNIPMLLKACRTRDVRSYSVTHIAMSNVGNAVHWVYILGLPAGPLWTLHGFYTITPAVMLIWYLQQRSAGARAARIDAGSLQFSRQPYESSAGLHGSKPQTTYVQ